MELSFASGVLLPSAKSLCIINTTRSQAPAWERAVLEALPPEAFEPATIRQAEPGLCDR